MRKSLNDILDLVGDKRKRLPYIGSIYLFSICLEILGLAIVVPIISVAQSPDIARTNEYTGAFFSEYNDKLIVFIVSFIFLGFFILKSLTNIYINRKIINFSYDLQGYLRTRLGEIYINAPYSFHIKKKSSEIINIMLSHVSQFSKGVVGSILKICGELFTIIFILVFLFYNSPKLTIIVGLILFFVSIVYIYIIQRRLKCYGEELIDLQNRMLVSVNQGIKGVKESRVIGTSGYFSEKIATNSIEAASVNAKISYIQILPRFIFEITIAIIIVGLLLYSTISNETTGISLADLTVFALAALRLLPGVTQINTALNSLAYSFPTMREMKDDLELLRNSGKAAATSKTTNKVFETLRIAELNYRYPGDNFKTLDNISVEFKKGEVVGIFGPSGSGKSTLINVILGLLEPEGSVIQLNGKTISFDEWRANSLSCYVPQRPLIMDATIAGNVALGINPEKIDHNRVMESLKKSQLAKYISSLPHATESEVGEDGNLLSAGQMQRLAVARSFYFDRKVVVFDEATSALDPETEIDLLAEIRDMRKEAAIIMVSHSDRARLYCDRIYTLGETNAKTGEEIT